MAACLLAGVSISLAMPSYAQQGMEYHKAYQVGRKAMKKENYKEACKQFNRAMDLAERNSASAKRKSNYARWAKKCAAKLQKPKKPTDKKKRPSKKEKQLMADIQRCMKTRGVRDEEIKRLNTKIASLNSEKLKNDKQIKDLEAQTGRLNSEGDRLSKQVRDLRAKKSWAEQSSKKDQKRLQDQIDQLKKLELANSTALNRLRKENVRLSKALKARQKDVKRLRAQTSCSGDRAAITQMQADNATLEEEKRKLHQQVRQHQSEAARLGVREEACNQKTKRLETEKAALVMRAQDAERGRQEALSKAQERVPCPTCPNTEELTRKIVQPKSRNMTIAAWWLFGVGMASAACAGVLYGVGTMNGDSAYQKYWDTDDVNEMNRHWKDVESAETTVNAAHVLVGVGGAFLISALIINFSRPSISDEAPADQPQERTSSEALNVGFYGSGVSFWGRF